MKKIPVTVHVDCPETLDEAIQIYGKDQVFKHYLAMWQIDTIQTFRAANKIRYSK